MVFDRHWQKKAMRGDPTAIHTLVEHATNPLYQFVFYRVGGEEDLCEEIVQETLTLALRRLERYDPQRAHGEIFGWLQGLARNEIRRTMTLRRRSTSFQQLWEHMDEELLLSLERMASEALDQERIDREETRTLVNATMSQLPLHYREILEAKYVEGLSVQAIAAARALTEKAIESQLTRARKAFKETFQILIRTLNPDLPPLG